MEGVKRWNLTNLIAAVPMILHLALLAFFVGLLLWLIPLNHTVWVIVLVLCSLWLSAYLATACIPCIWHDAPYVWPTSILLEKALKNVKIVFSHIYDLDTFLSRLRTQARPALPTSLPLVIQSQDIQLSTKPEARILVTYIDRNKASAYDNLVTSPDNLDIQILFSLMKDSRTSLPLETTLELIYRKIQNDQSFRESGSVVEGEILTEIINRASQSAISCRSSINGYLEITPGALLNRITVAMQFFDAAIQTIDFERDNRKSCFQPLLETADLLMERALHIRSLDELVLHATLSVRLQLKLGLFYHLDRALEIIEAIRTLGPVPDLKRGPRGLGWPTEQIAKWQMVISPYLHSLTLMILQAFPPQRTSQGSKFPGTALEDTRDMIPDNAHPPSTAPRTIRVGGSPIMPFSDTSLPTSHILSPFRRLMGLTSAVMSFACLPRTASSSVDNYPVLREVLKHLWTQAPECSEEATDWMRDLLRVLGWDVHVADDGTHYVEPFIPRNVLPRIH
ncbi:hypothetical protein FRC17_010094 [Serendipita sp. 399]|nr:hypothetical protein FRC17_010094 [Serendipita sp. 399]